MTRTIRSQPAHLAQGTQPADWRCLLTRRDVRRAAARNARATAVSGTRLQRGVILTHLLCAACAAAAISAAVWMVFAPVIGAISTLTF